MQSNGIRFPKVHISKSVVTTILNVARELERQKELKRLAAQAAPAPTPNVPDPALEGSRLDTALSTPLAPMGGMDGPNSPGNNTAEAVLSGGKPIQGLLDTLSGQ